MKKIFLIVMISLCAMITKSQTCDTTFKTFTNVTNPASTATNKCKARYVTHKDNYPKTGQQTWYYEVYSGTPAVSHTIFGFPSCLTIKQMGKYNTYDSSTFTKYSNVSYGIDNSIKDTSIFGYKFDYSITEGTKAKYYITVDRIYKTGTINLTIKGATTYDTKTFCGPDMNCEALPITLLSYNIIEDKENDILIWNTATEVDIEYYEVALIGKDTTILDRISVEGNSSYIKTYRNVYSKPDMVNYYYKVSAVNYSGYVDNIFLLFPKLKNNSVLYISPNPTNNYIRVPDNVIGDNLHICDIEGKLVFDTTIKSNEVRFDIQPGIYFIYCGYLRNKLIIF